MEQQRIEDLVQNVNDRLAQVEHILPTLTTKTEIREEGEHPRRHFDAVVERLESHIRLLAEGQVALGERMDHRFEQMAAQIDGVDRRVMRLEVARRG